MTFRQFFKLSRPVTLAATVSPVLVGATSAWDAGTVNVLLAAGFAAVALLLQISANLVNEAADFRRGLDREDSLGIAGVIVRGEVTGKDVMRAAFGTLALAAGLGAAVALERGLVLVVLGVIGAGAVFFYNAGPRPVSATPLGELLVFFVMGPIEVAAAELAAGGQLTAAGLFASCSVGFLVAGILLANNLRDAPTDARGGRHTLAVVLGRSRAGQVLIAMVMVGVLWPSAGAALGVLPRTAFITLAAVPLVWPVLKRLTANPPVYPALLPAVARLHMAAGLLLAVSFAWSVL